jgi:hypothetical protein
MMKYGNAIGDADNCLNERNIYEFPADGTSQCQQRLLTFLELEQIKSHFSSNKHCHQIATIVKELKPNL